MTAHLLPPSAAAAERALSLAAGFDDLRPERIKALWDPRLCPAELLPWLAWSWHVDDWDETWSEDTKRAVVAAAWEVHRFKGTPWAVRRALKALKYRAEIDEDTGVPYVFDLSVELTGAVDIDAFTAKAVRAVELSKPASRHLGRVAHFVQTAGRIAAAAAVYGGATVEVWPRQPERAETGGPIFAALAAGGFVEVDVRPLA